jgi:hypothetical protein
MVARKKLDQPCDENMIIARPKQCQRSARSYWVDVAYGSKCEMFCASRCFPLRLQTQTLLDAVSTSRLGQMATLPTGWTLSALPQGLDTSRLDGDTSFRTDTPSSEPQSWSAVADRIERPQLGVGASAFGRRATKILDVHSSAVSRL